MHRNIKPDKFVIDRDQKKLRLIGFGIADFYVPETIYSVKAGTRLYQGPERILGFETYDYSVDMWSMGCVFAEIILNKKHLFSGSDFDEMLL